MILASEETSCWYWTTQHNIWLMLDIKLSLLKVPLL